MGKVDEVDILNKQLEGIYLTRIQGSDGKSDHCVVVSNQWIFYSNCERALERNIENLNLCCSSDEVQCEFVRVVEFEHFPKITNV